MVNDPLANPSSVKASKRLTPFPSIFFVDSIDSFVLAKSLYIFFPFLFWTLNLGSFFGDDTSVDFFGFICAGECGSLTTSTTVANPTDSLCP